MAHNGYNFTDPTSNTMDNDDPHRSILDMDTGIVNIQGTNNLNTTEINNFQAAQTYVSEVMSSNNSYSTYSKQSSVMANVEVSNKFGALEEDANEAILVKRKRNKSASDAESQNTNLANNQVIVKNIESQMVALEKQHMEQIEALKHQLNAAKMVQHTSNQISTSMSPEFINPAKKRVFTKIRTNNATSLVSNNSNAKQQPPVASTSKQNTEEVEAKDKNNTNKSRIPPIVAYSLSVNWLRNQLTGVDFKIKNINSNMCNIFVNDVQTFVKVRQILSINDIYFYTYTPKEIKPVNLLIKGLDSSFEANEIKDELETKFPDLKFIKVAPFTTKNAINNEKNLNIWFVQVAPDADISDFKKLKFILHSVVRVETLKSSGPIQCFNCQRFDHLSANCGMGFRCVKCAQNHGPSNCPVVNESELKCANCGGNHVSSFRSCPKYLEYTGRKHKGKAQVNNTIPVRIENVNTRSSFRAPKITLANNSNVFKSQSYAQAVKGTEANRHTHQTGNSNCSSPIGFLNNEINSLFGMDFTTIMMSIKNFLPFYNSLTDVNEKKIQLLSFLFDLSSNNNDK